MDLTNTLDLVLGWRRIGVSQWGPPGGFPVFLLHGTPGSRLGIRPSDAELDQLGVRLITYDRPGYGRSDALPERSVAQAADDVRAIADALRVDSFAVLGRSGGGPHALACAALLPDRVTGVASLVAPAPYGAAGLDWLAGMADWNQLQYSAAVAGRSALLKVLFPEVMALRSNPDLFGHRLFAPSAADGDLLRDADYRHRWLVGTTEAVGRSLEGWAADTLALTHPWGFQPELIRVPALLWHGVRDVFAPVAHGRWLASRIRGATLTLSDHSSHLQTATAQFDALRWLVDGGPPEAMAG